MDIAATIMIILLVLADRFTKYIAAERLRPVSTVPIIEGVFSLTYVENMGAAFGILQGARWVFVIITVAVLIMIFLYYRKLPAEKPYIYVKLCLALIAAGAVGNFIDRVMTGRVVDFLHFTLIDFPVFNLADCFVCVGAGLLSFLIVFVIKD